MFVAEQQLTSLSPPKKPDVSVGFLPSKERFCAIKKTLIAHDGCAAELSVARSTNASKLARFRCKANALFLRNPRSRRDVCCKATTDLSLFAVKICSVLSNTQDSIR